MSSGDMDNVALSIHFFATLEVFTTLFCSNHVPSNQIYVLDEFRVVCSTAG